MPVKVVFFYNQAAQGWTETYYASGNDPVGTLNVITDFNLGRMVTWRSNPTILYGVRCTLVGDARMSVSKVTGGRFFGQGNVANLDIRPDVASTDAMYLLRGVGFHKRTLALRGLLDEMVKRDINGNDVETPLLKDGRDILIANLKAMGLGILWQSRPPAVGAVPNPILSVVPDPALGSQSILTVLNPPNLVLPVPRKVTVLGIPTNDLPGFPKAATVVAVTAGPPHKVTVAYRFRNVDQVNPGRMRYIEQIFNVDPIDRMEFVGFRERKTGRPFGQPRGRTRPAVRAQ